MNIDIKTLINTSEKAGKAILEIYDTNDFAIEAKADNSPLTLADSASHNIIKDELLKFFPEIPLLSEEDKEIPYEERKNWETFWLVDPLDGTKEFIKKNGEFTVNIALIENNIPVLGVIFAPVLNVTYFADKNKGAYKKENGLVKKIAVQKREHGLTAVKSRSHSSEEEEQVLSQFNITNFISIGSSLKFCMVAEGKADIYYRHGPTMEWDTAAGQAIVQEAGGTVTDLNNRIFSYNKQNLLNSSFLVKG